MRVVVTVQHPGHVHFFRHAVADLRERGHEVHVFARENEVAIDLLDAFGIDHEVLAGEADSLLELAGVQATYEARLLARARRLDPDVITAIGGVAAAHVARAVDARSVVFYDTEHATLIRWLAYPLADVVCTPDCYAGSTLAVGGDHATYPGYHELAYLHPERFTPDEGVLDAAGVADAERLVVCRFSGWDSSHDVGEGGFDDPVEVVERLREAGAAVRLTSETALPPALEEHRLSIAPERMHDLLYYADLTIGEGATTAAESALLGTPAVYVNTLSMGYTTELAERYGLLFHYDGPRRHERGLERGLDVLEADDDARWDRRRAAVLADKRDTTDVILRQVLAGAG